MVGSSLSRLVGNGSVMFYVNFSVACSVGFCASRFPSMSSVMVVSTLIKLWAPFFTRERLSDDLRLVVVVSNKAFGVDLGTAVPKGQVTRISVEVNGIIVDRLLGHIYRTRY